MKINWYFSSLLLLLFLAILMILNAMLIQQVEDDYQSEQYGFTDEFYSVWLNEFDITANGSFLLPPNLQKKGSRVVIEGESFLEVFNDDRFPSDAMRVYAMDRPELAAVHTVFGMNIQEERIPHGHDYYSDSLDYLFVNPSFLINGIWYMDDPVLIQAVKSSALFRQTEKDHKARLNGAEYLTAIGELRLGRSIVAEFIALIMNVFLFYYFLLSRYQDVYRVHGLFHRHYGETWLLTLGNFFLPQILLAAPILYVAWKLLAPWTSFFQDGTRILKTGVAGLLIAVMIFTLDYLLVFRIRRYPLESGKDDS